MTGDPCAYCDEPIEGDPVYLVNDWGIDYTRVFCSESCEENFLSAQEDVR